MVRADAREADDALIRLGDENRCSGVDDAAPEVGTRVQRGSEPVERVRGEQMRIGDLPRPDVNPGDRLRIVWGRKADSRRLYEETVPSAATSAPSSSRRSRTRYWNAAHAGCTSIIR